MDVCVSSVAILFLFATSNLKSICSFKLIHFVSLSVCLCMCVLVFVCVDLIPIQQHSDFPFSGTRARMLLLPLHSVVYRVVSRNL